MSSENLFRYRLTISVNGLASDFSLVRTLEDIALNRIHRYHRLDNAHELVIFSAIHIHQADIHKLLLPWLKEGREIKWETTVFSPFIDKSVATFLLPSEG